MKLSELLWDYVRKENISRRELARRIKTNATSTLAYLDGSTLPGPEVQQRIATAFGLTLDELRFKLFGIPVQPQKGVEQVLSEIRLMERSDFLKVAHVVIDRFFAELEPEKLPK